MSPERVGPRSEIESETPRGREAIRKAVLDAADVLFATRRPSQISIREIAALAGVNHALVHRHFETKENLVREALERADARLSLRWEHLTNAGDVANLLLGHRETYHHALLMLEGAVMDGAVHGASSRLVDGLIDRLKAEGVDRRDATTASVTAVALLLGWATYGEWLSSASHPLSDSAHLESGIAATLDDILHVGSDQHIADREPRH